MQSGFWRNCRVGFRWCRRAVLVAVVTLICAFVWFDRVGVPDFLERRLVETLREHGVELEFARMRFSLIRGLIAENVRVGHTAAPDSPAFSLEQIELELDIAAALHGRLQLNGLALRNGKFVLPLSPTNTLTLDNIQTDLRFPENDTWSLDDFKARFAGAKLALSGDLAHAPEIRNWAIFRGAGNGNPAATRAQLKAFSDVLGKIRFLGAPQLNLNFSGDARDINSFRVRLAVTAPAVQSPWGGAHGFQFTARLSAPANAPTNPNAAPGLWTNLQPFQITWTAQAAELQAGAASADTVECDGVWHSPELTVTKFSAQQGAWTPGWTVRDIEVVANLTAPTSVPTNSDSSWSWWTNLQPYCLVWTANVAQLKSDTLNADSISCGGSWRAPELAVTNLSAQLGGGQLEGRAWLNVATREFGFTNASRFDLHAVAALLTDKTRERLAEFSWTEPPSLRAGGSLVLPAWTNRQPDWRDEVQPTIQLLGELAFTNGMMLGANIDSAAARFTYSNLVWLLPAVTLAQSKTRLEISGSEDDATKDYRWHVSGAFDPAAIRPFLTASNAVHGFAALQFTEPVRLDADVCGQLYDYDSIGAAGRVALTNFSIRGEAVDSVAGGFAYTNRVLEFTNPRLWRGAQTMTADRITLDFNRRLISFKNGYSTTEPELVARAIGPKTGEIMEPYHFLQPPTVLVEGRVPLRDVNEARDVDDADLTFNIVGGVPFQCLKLRAARVTGTIHWLGETLILTNIAAELYGGAGNGFANFDFRVPHEGADYQFTAAVTNVHLRALAADLSPTTNHLEGTLSGWLVVTRADSRDWRTLDGFGQARLRDGLIWDIPLFGILSPVLNAVSPGLGNSRATDASAAFAITNGVIFSDPLEMNTAMTRLEYSGTVDLRENVNARVTAQLLHNVWGIGPVISTIFTPVTKLFEYKVTGTLTDPKKEPVYVPKFFLLPLHPIRTFEELVPGGDYFTSPTNAPPSEN